jgi:two-component system cell cycle response regulator
LAARILVIEDNAANLDLIIYLLEAFGHTTEAARDGQEGLDRAGAWRPDLIICDVQLPKLDGYAVVARLKSDPALHEIPVLAVTALAMVGDRDRMLQAGFDGYVAKPIDPESFMKRIDPYLSARTAARNASIETQSAAMTVPKSGEGRLILAVDNVAANLELAASLLVPFGYHVITACGGREGLEEAQRNRPDVIVSDVCMEDGSGYDFIRTVKSDPQLASIPFIFITSSLVEEKDRAKGLAMGAARFLIRPIEPEKLLSEIEACLPKPADKENRG